MAGKNIFRVTSASKTNVWKITKTPETLGFSLTSHAYSNACLRCRTEYLFADVLKGLFALERQNKEDLLNIEAIMFCGY